MRRPGIKILDDQPGDGAPIERQQVYQMRLKMCLNRGEAIRWQRPWGMIDRARLEDQGETLVSDLRYDRENLIAGMFQGIDGMRIGGRRKLKISPHLAYGEAGLAGQIPPNSVMIVEVEIIEQRIFPKH